MVWLLVAGTLAAVMDAPGQGDLTAALAREQAGDSEGALEALQVLVRAAPTDVLPRLESARLRLKLGGDVARVEEDLGVAAAADPSNPHLHYLRGLVWEERGKPFRAVHDYEQALAVRPDYEDARFRVAGLCASLGDWIKAELHYRFLSRARPEWVQVRLQLIQALEHQGRGADAERELVRLREEQPGNVLVLRRLAELYERTGRKREAARVRALLQPPAPPKKMRPLRPSKR